MSVLSLLTTTGHATGPRLGLAWCSECGWYYAAFGLQTYCSAIVADRVCGQRLTVLLVPVTAIS